MKNLFITLLFLQNAGGLRPPVHSSRPLAAVPAAVITFRTTAQVRGRMIRLADIALVESDQPGLLQQLEAVEVGAAPLCGHSRTVSAAYAKVRIRQIGVDPDRLVMGGAELVTVSQPAQIVPGSAIEKAAREAVEAANPGTQAQLSASPQDLSLPTGAVVLKPQPLRMAGENSGTLPVRVLVDGREAATVTVSFRLSRMAPVVVAKRDLPLGTVLTADDVSLEQHPTTPGLVQLSDLSLAVGQEAAVPIKAGATLMPSQLRPAILIRRGARIRLVCQGPSFTATAAGEALQDGAAGQIVRVRNLSSFREVVGRVVDDQTAEVPF